MLTDDEKEGLTYIIGTLIGILTVTKALPAAHDDLAVAMQKLGISPSVMKHCITTTNIPGGNTYAMMIAKEKADGSQGTH